MRSIPASLRSEGLIIALPSLLAATLLARLRPGDEQVHSLLAADYLRIAERPALNLAELIDVHYSVLVAPKCHEVLLDYEVKQRVLLLSCKNFHFSRYFIT